MNTCCRPEGANSTADSSDIEHQAIDRDNEENACNANTPWDPEMGGFDVEVKRTERTNRTTITYRAGHAPHDENCVVAGDSNMEDDEQPNDANDCGYNASLQESYDDRHHPSHDNSSNATGNRRVHEDDGEQSDEDGVLSVAQITQVQEEVTYVSKLHITPHRHGRSSEDHSTVLRDSRSRNVEEKASNGDADDRNDNTRKICQDSDDVIQHGRHSSCMHQREASYPRSGVSGHATFNPSFASANAHESSPCRPSLSFQDTMADDDDSSNVNNNMERDTRATTFTRGSHRLSVSNNSLHRTSVFDHTSARANHYMEMGAVVFAGPGPTPCCYNPTYMKLYRCFDRRNGLLFRIEDVRHHTWAFYNDTRNYVMHVTATFGQESMVRPLGETVQEMLDAENGQCALRLTIPPNMTMMFMKGECNGFATRYDAKPVCRSITTQQPQENKHEC